MKALNSTHNMPIITVRISEEIDAFLKEFCKEEDRTKAWLVKKALQEKMEDWQDYKIGVKAIQQHNSGNKKTHSIESVAKEFGVRLDRKKIKK